MLFHIHANRRDLSFELERLILDELGDAVRVEDEVHAFRYFDVRDLLGFVDGTANPVGGQKASTALVGDEAMLRRMFIGDPVGKHDRILDFSSPQTGCTFFAPTLEFL